MTLAGAWVAFPLLLVLVATTWGLLVETLAGRQLPGALLPAIGLAALAGLLTLTSNIAPDLNPSIVLGGAATGAGLCLIGEGPRAGLKSLRPRGAGLWAALIAFAIYSAPVVLYGHPAVSGFIRLDDSTTFLALGDWVYAHGRSTAGLPQSSYETSLQLYLASGYPVGTMLPLVAVGRMQGYELVWLWMPYIAVLGALLAATIELIIRPLAKNGVWRVVASALAAASALLYGYALWGGIKEVWTAALAATIAALVPFTIEATRGRPVLPIVRAFIPLAACIGGLASSLSAAGAIWAGPAVLVIAAGAAVVRGKDRLVPAVLAGAVVLGLALIPLVKQVPFVKALVEGERAGGERLGNLLAPLQTRHVAGIWPAKDFRVDPTSMGATTALIAIVVLGAAWAIARAVERRAWAVLAYGGVLLAAAAILQLSDWPWAEAKSLAIASPVALALAGAGAGDLIGSMRTPVRVAGGVVCAALVAGVLWSDALQFGGTTLSPYGRDAELAKIGDRFAGTTPTMFAEYDPYATRWILRKMGGEGAGALRRRVVPLVGGGYLQKGESADIDRFDLSGLDDYQALVLRRSPLASRPASSFRRVYRGHWYEVWKRDPNARPIVSHLGLGTDVDPGGRPSCSQILALAAQVPAGVVRAARAQNPIVAGLDPTTAPSDWTIPANGSLLPDFDGEGSVDTQVSVPRDGRYEIWLGGGFRGEAVISVDGREVGSDRHVLAYAGQVVPMARVPLTAGTHTVTVRLRNGSPLHPGMKGIDRFPIGPLALLREGGPQGIIEVPAAQARELCGRRLDWVEAVA